MFINLWNWSLSYTDCYRIGKNWVKKNYKHYSSSYYNNIAAFFRTTYILFTLGSLLYRLFCALNMNGSQQTNRTARCSPKDSQRSRRRSKSSRYIILLPISHELYSSISVTSVYYSSAQHITSVQFENFERAYHSTAAAWFKECTTGPGPGPPPRGGFPTKPINFS